MVLNGKTMLALDDVQAHIVHQALCQYQGPYGNTWTSLGPVECQRHKNMSAEAESMALELGNLLKLSHAQD